MYASDKLHFPRSVPLFRRERASMARRHSKPDINRTRSLIRQIFRRRFITIKIHNVKSRNISTKPFCLSAVVVYLLRISMLFNLNVARFIFYLLLYNITVRTAIEKFGNGLLRPNIVIYGPLIDVKDPSKPFLWPRRINVTVFFLIISQWNLRQVAHTLALYM